MSFLKGMAQAIGEKDQRDHETNMLDEKIQAERKNMLFSLAQKRATGGGTSGTGIKGTNAEMKANAKLLLNEGFSKDMVENLMATQNPDAIQTVTDTYMEQKETFQKTNGSIGMPPEYFKKFAEKLVVEEATKGNYDMADLQEKFRIELDPEELATMEGVNWTVPGAVAIAPDHEAEPLTQSEMAAFKSNLGGELIDEMNRQKNELNEILSGIAEREKKKDIGEVGRSLKAFAVKRLSELTDAENNFKETKAPSYLIGVLGTAEYAQKYFEYDKRLAKSPAFRSFKDLADKAAIDIGNLNMIEYLAAEEHGIIQPGTLFNHNGKTVVYAPSRSWLQKNSSTLPPSISIYLDGKIHSINDFM